MPRRMNRSQIREAWTRYVEVDDITPRTGQNKFNAVKVKVNGRTYDSTMEGARATELQWLLHLGKISDTKCRSKLFLNKMANQQLLTWLILRTSRMGCL
jgi:hypothetical protein